MTTTTDWLFILLILAVIIDAGAHVIHEARQRERDRRQIAMEADTALILTVLRIWAETWGQEASSVKAKLVKVLERRATPRT